MRKFKNPKAQQLFDEAEKLEEFANEKIVQGVCVEHGPGDWLTEAAGLRIQADELEEEYEVESEEDWER